MINFPKNCISQLRRSREAAGIDYLITYNRGFKKME
jgi:hypothetical protein